MNNKWAKSSISNKKSYISTSIFYAFFKASGVSNAVLFGRLVWFWLVCFFQARYMLLFLANFCKKM